ncbi:MAG: hypothetical protein QOG05_3423 [Streptosporangiaceae bacterium]|nr:hypothetical protein [Streptosporangiaceae bacterium]
MPKAPGNKGSGNRGSGNQGGASRGSGNRGGGNQGGGSRGPGNQGSGNRGAGNRPGGSKANRATARARVAEMRAQEAARKRRRNWLTGIGAAVVVIIAAVAITLAVTSNSGKSSSTAGGTPKLKLASLSTLGTLKPAPSPGPKGPEGGVPVPQAPALASTATVASGKTVDGISCTTTEQLVFHIHAHLTVFVNGAARQVPAGIGIPGAQGQNTPTGPYISSGTCFYWLHTHANDGIVHIESPVQRTFTLGNLFDIWGQPLSKSQVGPARGPVTALYNDKVYLGNPRDIPLEAHAQIQLQVGKPLVAPVSITFPSGL